MKLFSKIAVFFGLIFLLQQCGKDNDPDNTSVRIPSGKGFDLLSEYNFFEGDLYDLIPNSEAGVLPYDLNMPLFSDYASKKRFIYVPRGSIISFDTSSTLVLPLGSVLIKHFYYPNASGIDNYIETRLLIHQSNGWQAETYEWNTAQTEAVRTIVGGTRNLNVEINGQMRSINYLIPNQNQCKNCHAYNGKIEPIGPVIQNLNKPYDYATGMENQIDKWISSGILSSPSTSIVPSWPEIDDLSSSLNSRARAYLATNCASCHRLEGSAANSGLYLEYSNNDSASVGFFKSPVAAGAGSGGLTYVIKPGHADESILLFRMISDQVNARMPEIGRSIAHEEGIALIRDWIDSQ
jgi:uncharacterized repeat protein (TIGR03806 family)